MADVPSFTPRHWDTSTKYQVQKAKCQWKCHYKIVWSMSAQRSSDHHIQPVFWETGTKYIGEEFKIWKKSLAQNRHPDNYLRDQEKRCVTSLTSRAHSEVKNVLDKIATLTTISGVKTKNLVGLLNLVFEKSLEINWHPDNNLLVHDKDSCQFVRSCVWKNVLDKIGTLTTISWVKIKNRPLGASEGGWTLVQEGRSIFY